ncbi:hypothetical protein V8C42DRAFT_195153 [Trichoderma barbatum]
MFSTRLAVQSSMHVPVQMDRDRPMASPIPPAARPGIGMCGTKSSVLVLVLVRCAVVIADSFCKGTRMRATESVRSASLACPNNLQPGEARGQEKKSRVWTRERTCCSSHWQQWSCVNGLGLLIKPPCCILSPPKPCRS